MVAYNGLLRIGFIEVTQKDNDPDTNEGEITRIVTKNELLERLLELGDILLFQLRQM